VRRLVYSVCRSCAISFKPAKARYNSRLEELKQRLRRLLRRRLTPREEYLLELSQPIVESEETEVTPPDDSGSSSDAA
jgi:hypothetical protein